MRNAGFNVISRFWKKPAAYSSPSGATFPLMYGTRNIPLTRYETTIPAITLRMRLLFF